MKTDRRSLLKMFGVGSVAVVTATGTTRDDIEVVKDPDASPLPDRSWPIILTSIDVQAGSLYSELELSADRNYPRECHSDLFNYSVGQINGLPWGRLATMTQTNMYRPAQLSPPEVFLVERIGVVISPDSEVDDRRKLIDGYSFEFHIGQKVFFRRPIAEMFGVGEPIWKKPFPEFPIKGMIDLSPLPLIIPSMMNFHGVIVGRPWEPKAPIRFWGVLNGKHARSVQ